VGNAARESMESTLDKYKDMFSNVEGLERETCPIKYRGNETK
jgi:hypothetical protein